MSTAKDKIIKSSLSKGIKLAINFVKKDPNRDLTKVAEPILKIAETSFEKKKVDIVRRSIADENNPYVKMIKDMLINVDENIMRTFGSTMGYDAGIKGTKLVRTNREKYHCNIPWLILLDPTSACNLKCKGCWAAEYGNRLNLTLDDMRSIVRQGKVLGTHVYMFTGGEPLIRKKDILTLCEENRDCVFLAYTNATLVDDKFCEDLVRVGNLALALSIEGTRESNDCRRGDGAYETTINAMKMLKEHKCLFGISVCYTRLNDEYVTSDEFIDEMISLGSHFGFYFNYMPVGSGADKDLIPTPAQRKYMYSWMHRTRNGKTGKPMFVFDFQDDGEYVGGCIAGGRNYFHINSKGDMEPCVFIHYSDANIHTHSLLQGLQNPLFQAYRHSQPFNDNHLRPCPMLENPEKLREIIKQTGAESTDLIEKEDVDTLCGRCDEFALEWAPIADELWQTTPHPKIHTQYYRDE